MGHRGVLRRPGARAGDPPDRVLRPAAGAGPVKADTVKADTVKADTVKADTVKADTVKADTVKADTVKADTVKADTVKADTVKADTVKADTAMADTGATNVSRQRAVAGLALIVLAVAVIAFPLVFSSPVVTNYAIYALIFVAVVSAWNVFSGFSGYISLGQAVFFGSGAYTVGIAARDWHINGVGVFALLPLAAAVGAVIAVPFGLVALRVRRHTFIVITIAVFFIFQLAAANFSFTGGSVGVPAPFLPWSPTEFNDRFYYITLACAVAAIVVAVVVRRARFGLQLRAIRDDEDRARGLGVRTMRVKL